MVQSTSAASFDLEKRTDHATRTLVCLRRLASDQGPYTIFGDSPKSRSPELSVSLPASFSPAIVAYSLPGFTNFAFLQHSKPFGTLHG